MGNLPKAGPINGARMTKTDANPPPSSITHISAIVPAPTARVGLPNAPERNLHINSVSRFWASPAPMVKRNETGRVSKYTALRPWVSDIGAPIIGPKASPSE